MFTKSILAATLFAASTQAICSHNTHLYDRATATQFTYTGLTGPLNWHSLSPNNTLCAKGKYQTPINLDAGISTESGAGYVATYPTTLKAKYENLGTTVEVLGDAIGGTLTFKGTTYKLLQFHFHTPSEHRIDDEYFPLEVHFVHQNAGLLTRTYPCPIVHTELTAYTVAGGLAVLGFPIDVGSQVDTLLYQVLSQTDKIPNKNDEAEIGPLPFTSIVNALKSGTVYRLVSSDPRPMDTTLKPSILTHEQIQRVSHHSRLCGGGRVDSRQEAIDH